MSAHSERITGTHPLTREALSEIVGRIVQVAHPDKMILFGSAAHRQEALAGWQPAALGR